MEPRVVLVTRPTAYDALLAQHATPGQVRWFLSTRGQSIDPLLAAHRAQGDAVATVLRAVPPTWRHTRVGRDFLDRFLFDPEDVVVAVGQDGLVPNVAKYLSDQPVIGINPDPTAFDGVLVRHLPAAAADVLRDVHAGRARLEARTMLRARTDDGQELRALNEVFVGHRTHQSARYTLSIGGQQERHSSSGLIVSTGTGSTGWAKSIHAARGSSLTLPAPEDPSLAFFVREAWGSVATGTAMQEGLLADAALAVVSEMDHGVVFGDGIEQDAIALPWAREVTIDRDPRVLRLVA
ncbi:MAG: hypothetical protein ACI8PZ_002023 [Myxococcota bacterium]|jgi:hypothetical protein